MKPGSHDLHSPTPTAGIITLPPVTLPSCTQLGTGKGAGVRAGCVEMW